MTIDINNLFIKVRANSGDSLAKECIDNNNRIQEFDLQLESLSMSLSMEFNRLQNSALQRIRSKSIGKEINNIVNSGLDKLITIYLENEALYEKETAGLLHSILRCMAPSTYQISEYVSNLNIVLDFENMAYKIKDLPYDEIIRVLKCNLIKTVQRRSQRRQFLPNF